MAQTERIVTEIWIESKGAVEGANKAAAALDLIAKQAERAAASMAKVDASMAGKGAGAYTGLTDAAAQSMEKMNAVMAEQTKMLDLMRRGMVTTDEAMVRLAANSNSSGRELVAMNSGAAGLTDRMSRLSDATRAATGRMGELWDAGRKVNDVLRLSWGVRTAEDALVGIGHAAAGTVSEMDKVVEHALLMKAAFSGLRSVGLAVPGLQEIIVAATAVNKLTGIVSDSIQANDDYAASHLRIKKALEDANSASGLTATGIQNAARMAEQSGQRMRGEYEAAAEALVKFRSVSADNIGAFLRASEDLANRLGVSLPEAARKLGQWVDEGSKSFAGMAEAGIHLGYAVEQQAAAFEKAGNTWGASNTVLDSLTGTLATSRKEADESAASVHRYNVAWNDMIEGVGAKIGPFVAQLRSAWAFITAPMDWPRDIATSFMENLTDSMGTRPLQQQLQRDNKLLQDAQAERDRIIQTGGESAFLALQNVENRIAVLEGKIIRDKQGLAALGIDPDQVQADGRKVQATIDGNARAFDQLRAGIDAGLNGAIKPDLEQRIKGINSEFLKTRDALDAIRNPDGSNDLKIDMAIEDAMRLRDAQIAAAKEMTKGTEAGDDFTKMLEGVSEMGRQIEKQKLDKSFALFTSTVQQGLTPAEKYRLQVEATNDALERLRASGFEPTQQEIEAINRALMQANPAWQEAQKAAEEYRKELDRVQKHTEDRLVKFAEKSIFDTLSGKAKNFWESFKEFGLHAMAQLAAEYAVRPFIHQIGTPVVGDTPTLFEGVTA
ncbi:hypothetical protein [Azospirillum sp. TSO22-1]|uniref:hypothetical protein n=1 Tax=Azospirillum sp. TSO22-1 TaxID=716789 RepID=UPI000D60D933|nr:hypothetical protein [Azospirillum sp. TSO22-1]PWC53275.1 hypothetical protein TSO221_11410 [Azospirillum sp. TSO22-1]